MLGEMGEIAGRIPGIGIKPADVWTRVVAARDVRGENHQANELLARIYSDGATSAEERARCAQDLARRSAKGDVHIGIYLDHLKQRGNPAGEPGIVKLLAGVCAVDISSGTATLKRAAEVGKAVIDLSLKIPGAHRSLGLHALLVLQNPTEALPSLEAAFKEDSKDPAALEGLLVACLRTGAYERIAALGRQPGLTSKPEIAGLVKLGVAMQWLDSSAAGPPPCLAADLETVNAGEQGKDSREAAIGRLHLIEGNVRRANDILGPLADRCPDNVRWTYYACWAASLTGSAGAIARRLPKIAGSPSSWTVSALLLDADPAMAEKREIQETFKHPSVGYLEVSEGRLAMVRSASPRNLRWKPGAGPLEEQLEGLRTLLGHSAQALEARPLAQWMDLPLFGRLPLADRLFWGGLHSLLAGKADEGCAILEQAVKLGHRRAGLVLAVHFLKQNQPIVARRHLEQSAADRADVKIQLLRAYLGAIEGRSEEAVLAVEPLAAKGDGRANYAMGAIYWQRADQARRAGQSDRAHLYWEQAAGAFGAALKSPLAPPPDCELLSRCAGFVAHPARQEALASWIEALRRSGGLNATRTQSWLSWNVIVCSLWARKPSLSAELAVDFLDLLDSADSLSQVACNALAQQLACIAVKSSGPAEAGQCGHVIASLPGFAERPSLQRFHRTAATAAERLRLAVAGPRERASVCQQILRLAKVDSGNAGMALLAARAQLLTDEPAAPDALADVHLEDELEQKLCECLAALLAGRSASPERLPRPAREAPVPLLQACDLLQAAAAFVSGNGQGYEALLAVMRRDVGDLSSVTDPGRLLPALCANSTRRSVPAALVESVRRLKPRKGQPGEMVTMARCAAAVGEVDLACQWFEGALSGDVAGAHRQEYVEYLAHLAVVSYKSGQRADAARQLERAIPFCGDA